MRTLTERDAVMYNVMESLKRLSKCVDKQVVCLLVNDASEIVSIGINSVNRCDKNCHDKEHRICDVTHAEIMAIRNLAQEYFYDDSDVLTAYVSLFPCKACQIAIAPFVKEIVTFGMAHKEWVSNKISVFGHPVYSTIGDYVWEDPENCLSAYVDQTEIQESCLQSEKIAKQRYDRDFYAHLNRKAYDNMRKRLEDFAKNGASAYTVKT